jgi:hypothetical protein
MLNHHITLKERRWSTPVLTTPEKISLNHVRIPKGRSPKVTNSCQLLDQRKSREIPSTIDQEKWKDRKSGAKGTKYRSKQRSSDQDKGISMGVDLLNSSVINGCIKEP